MGFPCHGLRESPIHIHRIPQGNSSPINHINHPLSCLKLPNWLLLLLRCMGYHWTHLPIPKCRSMILNQNPIRQAVWGMIPRKWVHENLTAYTCRYLNCQRVIKCHGQNVIASTKRKEKGRLIYQHYINSISTLYQHYINIISTLYQHYINIISTLYQHYINIISTLYQHYINIISTLYQHYINMISTLYQHYINMISTLYHHYINIISTLYQHYINIISTLYQHLMTGHKSS